MTPTKQQILNAVCIYYKVDAAYIFFRDKKKERIEKRQMAMYLLMIDSQGTLFQCTDFIEEVSGHCYDHATIMHSRKKIHDQRKFYPNIQFDIDRIREFYPKEDFTCIKFQNNTSGLTVNYLN